MSPTKQDSINFISDTNQSKVVQKATGLENAIKTVRNENISVPSPLMHNIN
jgi:hypothetical protein